MLKAKYYKKKGSKLDMSNKNKIILSAIFLLIVLICILSVLIYIYTTDKLTISEQKLKYINSDEWNGELYPEGMPNLFRNYSGNLTCQNIGKSFDYVVNVVVPKYAKEFRNSDENEINTYFETNKDVIALEVGIKNNEDFNKLVSKIKASIKKDEIEFESFYVDADSIKQYSNITRTNLYIKYKECEELVLNVKINGNKISNSSAVEYK
jgi:hypothetical protein